MKLTEREQVRVGRELLGVMDAPRRAAWLKDLESALGQWATAVAHVPNVNLRSDLLSRAEPLAARVETLWKLIQRDPELIRLAAYTMFVDIHELRHQLSGFGQLIDWLKTEKSKRGGERPAYLKQVNAEWETQLSRWFDKHTRKLASDERNKRRSSFLRIARAAVKRAVPA